MYFASEAEKGAQRYYQSCLQSKRIIFATGAGPDETLLKLLGLIGGIPAKDEISYMHHFKTKEWDFQAVFQTVQNVFHVDSFFRWEVVQSSPPISRKKDPVQHIIKV